MKPPQNITIELEDKDVRADMNAILESMAKIREEAMTERGISNKQKDEYLHLACRLASGIRATADSDTQNKMQQVAEMLDKNNLLFNYDPKQDGYWKKEKSFISSLDAILLSAAGESLGSFEDRHHILQAIKYLGAGNSAEEREKVYDSITPFAGAVAEKEKTFSQKLFSLLFGERIKAENSDSLTLKLDCGPELLQEAREAAKQRGYSHVRIQIATEYFDEFKKQNPDARAIEVTQRAKDNSTTTNKLRKSTKALVVSTSPISYPLLGSFLNTRDVVHNNKFVDYLYPSLNASYKESHSLLMFFSSLLANIGLGAELIYAGGANHYTNLILTFSGIYLIGEQVVRLATGIQTDRGIPSLPYYLASLPFRPFLKQEQKSGERLEVELNVAREERTRNTRTGLNYLEQIAGLQTTEEVEQNLIWDENNNHAFGKDFTAYVTEKIIPQNKLEAEVDRKNQSVVYSESFDNGKYQQNSSLICFSDRRYLATTMTDKTKKDSPNFTELFAQEQDSKKVIEKISKAGLKYLHVRKYESGKINEDYEVIL